MAKQLKLYAVRDEQGACLGTYRATSAAIAISAHKAAQAIYFSTFRGGYRKGYVPAYTATIEDPR